MQAKKHIIIMLFSFCESVRMKMRTPKNILDKFLRVESAISHKNNYNNIVANATR